jgi:hypothetical protein
LRGITAWTRSIATFARAAHARSAARQTSPSSVGDLTLSSPPLRITAGYGSFVPLCPLFCRRIFPAARCRFRRNRHQFALSLCSQRRRRT